MCKLVKGMLEYLNLNELNSIEKIGDNIVQELL